MRGGVTFTHPLIVMVRLCVDAMFVTCVDEKDKGSGKEGEKEINYRD